jgi:hypothetical protein
LFLLTNPLYAAGSKKDGDTNPDGILIIDGSFQKQNLHPIIKDMKPRIEDFSKLSQRQKKSIQEKSEQELKDENQIQDPNKKEEEKKTEIFKTVTPEDVVNALKNIGINRENINISNDDLHEIIIQFICEDKRKSIRLDNQNIKKEELESISISCF